MELVKASDLKKIFVNWSNGTLYNRIESLQIRGNPLYTVRNETTGVDLYNAKAIEVLKERYIKENIGITDEEKRKIDKLIFDYLSNKSSKDKSSVNEQKERKNNLKNDKTDNNDNSKVINDVNIDFINENYILKDLHNEIINSLNKQIDILQKQLDKQTETNKNLVDTIKFREQKDAIIEQQNLVKLQDDVKFIAEPREENQDQKELERKGGLVAWFKDLKKYI